MRFTLQLSAPFVTLRCYVTLHHCCCGTAFLVEAGAREQWPGQAATTAPELPLQREDGCKRNKFGS
jgi:hypothetical protein